MNFKDLLDVADYNRAEAKNEAKVKRYTSELPPPKKLPKAGVQSDGIKKFLEKRKAEEEAKLAEARKQKEKLLALRAQNSKNNKKAKIMASRTKDNDFSKIRLTEDEILSKKKIETQLQRKHLADKVERMKARIELEEKEKQLPKKRKRKSKMGDGGDFNDDPHFDENRMRDEEKVSKEKKKPPRPPPPPAMSFSELLKVAEAKQHEPVVIPQKKKEDEKLLTKKQRRIEEQEQDRIRRKMERENPSSKSSSKPTPTDKNSLQNGKAPKKQPVVIHVEKDYTPCRTQTFKVPKGSTSDSKTVPGSKSIERDKPSNEKHSKHLPSAPKFYTNHDREKCSKGEGQKIKSQNKQTSKDENRTISDKKPSSSTKPLQKKSSAKIAPVPTPPPVTVDTDAIAAAIEKRIREKIEKEIEEKLAAKFAASMQSTASESESKPPGSMNGSHISVNGKKLSKGPSQQIPSRIPQDKLSSKSNIPSKKSGPPPPVKRPFHPNPYLDPPRRRLEPVRPQKPVLKRRIVDEDSDEDDMSDFIDDGPSQNDEDYSKYIQEIFNYDRTRYLDEDDDDIVETSFGEQLNEETRSARLGFLEDMEEEKKERELEKKRKMRKKIQKA